MKYYRNHWCEPDSAESCLISIMDLAIDYDGCRTVESLQELIDEMSSIAADGLRFLAEEKVYRSDQFVDEDYLIN